MIKNPLYDVLPPRYRKLAYALATVAAFVFTVWQASQGDWSEFFGGLFASLVGGTAASNTDAKDDHEPVRPSRRRAHRRDGHR